MTPTTTPPPDDRAVVRAEVEQEVNAIAARFNRDELPENLGILIPSLDLQRAIDRIMRLIDAQYNQGLEAAEGALPEKIDVKLVILASGPQSLAHGYAAGSNAAIGAARQQIRALKRKES